MQLAILIISTVIMGETQLSNKSKITILSVCDSRYKHQIIIPSIYSTAHVTLTLLIYYQLLTEFDGSFDALTKLHNRAAFDNMANKLDGKNLFPLSLWMSIISKR